MAGAKRLPKKVVAKAREAAEQSTARPPEKSAAGVSHSDLRPPTSDLKKQKVVAHLRRLHPMD